MINATCACFPTDRATWEYVGDVPDPQTQIEWNPYCPVHFIPSEAYSDQRACSDDCDTLHTGPCDNCASCNTGICPTHGDAEGLPNCPTHAVCPNCRGGMGHWTGERYMQTVQSRAALSS
jgi:hypothetical protein